MTKWQNGISMGRIKAFMNRVFSLLSCIRRKSGIFILSQIKSEGMIQECLGEALIFEKTRIRITGHDGWWFINVKKSHAC